MNESGEHRRVLDYVERWGVIFEQLGSTRMVGKILGWLMVADPPHQTASQIAEGIAASAASVSNGTRSLLQMGMIERVGVRGERSYHYRVGRTWWNTLIDH
ncbi:MAG: MarR family transcriptional regulator, partial [Candidatus Eisenbacteria bacterium]|nr:MarR family transcriptional regulator [Candidatus Eisenbacteria bacterium]